MWGGGRVGERGSPAQGGVGRGRAGEDGRLLPPPFARGVPFHVCMQASKTVFGDLCA